MKANGPRYDSTRSWVNSLSEHGNFELVAIGNAQPVKGDERCGPDRRTVLSSNEVDLLRYST